MSTVIEKLNEILVIKNDIKSAIRDKGVEIADNTPFADYPNCIRSIEQGGDDRYDEGYSDGYEAGSANGGGNGGEVDSFYIDFFNTKTNNGANYSSLYRWNSSETIDISNLNDDNVENIDSMFGGCSDLTTIIGIEDFNATNLDNLSCAFEGCRSLESLDLSSWSLSDKRELRMIRMFNECRNLREVSLPSISMVEWEEEFCYIEAESMFSECESLQELDFSKWSNIILRNCSAMFNNCRSLRTITRILDWQFDTDNFSYMFSGCESLEYLDLSGWNKDVCEAENMFNGCRNLIGLRIDNLNFENCGSTNMMFGDCDKLQLLYLTNCNQDTIRKIIESEEFPSGRVWDEELSEEVNRKMYVNRDEIGGLEAPDGWEFVTA